MDADPTVPRTRNRWLRLNRGTLLAALCVAVVVFGLTLCTPSGMFAPSYSSAPDFDGNVYGFPFGAIWIPIRSGRLKADFAPLLGDIAIASILFVAVEVARRRLRSWQFSLRRLLLAVFFVALSCGCFRLASVDDIQVAVIPGVLSIGLALGLLTNHFIVAIVGIALLALISCFEPCYRWDGAFPTGEIRLRVCDPSGAPIAGAQLDVYDCKARRVVRGPLLLLEDSQLPLLTDANGKVTCRSLGRGFSGVGRYLFWCIPIGFHSPDYEFHVSQKDHDSVRVRLWTLLDPSNKSSSRVTIMAYGQPMEMAVYSSTVTMPSKR
jgi:hypothetical protein